MKRYLFDPNHNNLTINAAKNIDKFIFKKIQNVTLNVTQLGTRVSFWLKKYFLTYFLGIKNIFNGSVLR